ncbi:hypothetical protein Tco_0973889 [Tanacetum coccineum]|uniref:Uncharacterized protein n=1 Tax=Tanacetum coccineum TaxID=301880 RepID=A0ABQ5EA37_9ASTR
MCELREDTFFENKDEDAHDHIDRVLSIFGLFNIPEVSKDPVMLRVFPFTLIGSAKRYYPPSMTAKQLEDIQNFKQEGDKSLYQAWERNIRSISSKDGLAALVNKLDNLGRDMKKLKEFKEVRYGELERTMPFNRNNGGGKILAETIKKYIEEASMSQVKQDEWLKTFFHNLEKSQNHHDEIIQGLESRVTNLAKEAVTKTDKNEDCKEIFTNDGAPLYTSFYYSPEEIEYFSANSGFSNDDEFKNVTSIPDKDLKQTSPKQTMTHYIKPYVPPIPFPKRLEQYAEEALIHKTMESLKKIKCSALLLNQLPLKKKDPRSFILPCSIRSNDFYDPEQCGDGRNNEIRERIIHNLHEEWFKGASDDENNIEGIIDYLKPTSYDGFVDLDEEEYNKRRCRLLGMPYIEPLPINPEARKQLSRPARLIIMWEKESLREDGNNLKISAKFQNSKQGSGSFLS